MINKIKNYLKNITINHIIVLCLVFILLLLFIQNRQLNKIIHKQITINNVTRHFNRDNFDRYYNNRIDREFERELINMKKELERNIRDFSDIERRFYKDFIDAGDIKIFEEFKDRDFDYKQHKRHNNFDKIKNMNRQNGFVYRPKIEQNENEFKLQMKLPKNINMENVKIDLQNNNLILHIEKNINIQDDNKNYQSYSHSSFFESFLLPETKSTVSNVKVDLNKNNNELTIIVPIIK